MHERLHEGFAGARSRREEGSMDQGNAAYAVLLRGQVSEALPAHIANPAANRYFSERFVVLDFEVDTSHGDFGHPVHPDNQMLLACWEKHWDGEVTMKSQWGDEFSMEELMRDIEKCGMLIAHNAKYELGWLHRMGLDISRVLVFDTKIAEYVLTGNLTSQMRFATSLDDCCIRRGWKPKDPIVDHMMRDGINPVRIPRPWLEGRCRQDVESTRDLFIDQRDMLKKRKQLQVMYTRCLLTPVLASVEFEGMKLDADRVRQAYSEHVAEQAKLQEEWDDFTGQVNINSDKQVAEFVYGTMGFAELEKNGKPIRTQGGNPKTDSDTITSLPAKTKEQKKFQKLYARLNSVNSALSKNLDFFYGCVEEGDGTFHAQFNQTVTATHRLSSSGMPRKFDVFDGKEKRVQFQNLPRKFKPLFTARDEDYLFCEWDGSGLEFRFAGLLSQDPMILNDINDPDFDPHTRSASVIYDKPGEEVTKTERTAAKAHTFKPLFGGSSGSRAEQRYYRDFNQRYAGLTQAQEGWVYQVVGDKQFATPWGLRFFFPRVKVDASGYVNYKNNIYNYPIQSGATAEVIPLAMVYFWHGVRALGLRVRVVNTVHDSVLCEVHKDDLEDYKMLAQLCWLYVYEYFERYYGFPLKGLPLGTEIVWGSHWTEGEEESFNIYPDGRIE